MIRAAMTAAVCLGGPVSAEIIDHNCLMTHLCPMASECIPQETRIVVRADTETNSVLFGLDGQAGALDLRRYGEGFLIASKVGDTDIRNTMVTIFPDRTMVYSVHIFNPQNVGIGLTALGRCDAQDTGAQEPEGGGSE